MINRLINNKPKLIKINIMVYRMSILKGVFKYDVILYIGWIFFE